MLSGAIHLIGTAVPIVCETKHGFAFIEWFHLIISRFG